ncbi:hypothetical protein OCU04_009049 [Sclerotinia nivalis]|uniref:Uncharacterized protein n=1 Tax=Sclerotinia nivalis TaxID=352851 RepID=A0A9X0DGC9_9HELO|nr:hypothetical protein OCU04_009049 [Sclerotinia nivalis]
MVNQPRILVEHAGSNTEVLYMNFLSLPEPDVDNIVGSIASWFEQINRKHREVKRFRQILKRIQTSKRVEKDYQCLFQLRYTEGIQKDDADIQKFIRDLPIGAFLQVVFRLTLNDLRGIRYCHFNDLAELLAPTQVSSNLRHLRMLENLPEYQHFLVELPGPLYSISDPQSIPSQPPTLDYYKVPPTSSISTTLSGTLVKSPEPHHQVSELSSDLGAQSHSPSTISPATTFPLVKRQRYPEIFKHSGLKISDIVNSTKDSQPNGLSRNIVYHEVPLDFIGLQGNCIVTLRFYDEDSLRFRFNLAERLRFHT